MAGRAGDSTPPVVDTPCIELASHPVVTNCRNCHTCAAWPDGQCMQSPGPDALANILPANPIFQNQLRANFLWTITDRAN